MRALLAMLLLGHAAAGFAQSPADVKAGVMQRDQMSEDLARAIRQDRARVGVPATDFERNRQLDQFFIRQNQDADRVNAQQQLETRSRGNTVPSPVQPEYDYQRFQAERRQNEALERRDLETLEREQRDAAERREPLRYSPSLENGTPSWGPRL